ncbi:MAG: sodium-dependent transporter [Pseudomonadota bacterium]
MNLPLSLDRWQSRTTFVLALSLAVVGLGNVARFSWLLGENGGAPFMLSYLLCLLGVSVPLLVAELSLGSHGRGSPFISLRWAAQQSGASRRWVLIAALTCFAAFLLLVVSVVFGGWVLSYAYQLQLGEFAAISLPGTATELERRIEAPASVIGWSFCFALFISAALAAGARRGLGTFVWFALPALLALLGALLGYAIEQGDLAEAGSYLFKWQALDYDGGSFFAAMGFALYTLTAGVAVGLSYGAYAPEKIPLVRSVLAVALFDVVVSIALAIVVLALTSSANLLPDRDLSLLFIALPYAFGNHAFGDFYGSLFFLALLIMLLGSAVALMEPLVASFEQQTRLNRWRASALCGAVVWLFGALLSWGFSQSSPGSQVVTLLDQTATYGLIPSSLVLLALFVGWRMPLPVLRKELAREPEILFRLWYFLVRFVSIPLICIAWLWLMLVP